MEVPGCSHRTYECIDYAKAYLPKTVLLGSIPVKGCGFSPGSVMKTVYVSNIGDREPGDRRLYPKLVCTDEQGRVL